jgi:hypothetical protein
MEWDNYQENRALVEAKGLAEKVDLWNGRIMTVYTKDTELEKGRRLWSEWDAGLAASKEEDWSQTKWTLGPEAEKVSAAHGMLRDSVLGPVLGVNPSRNMADTSRRVASRAPLVYRPGSAVLSTRTNLRPS